MDYIGFYVKAFESGNKGSLALSQCGNDWGLSCGSYQLTLRWGNCINFLKKYFPNQSSKLYFNNKSDFASNSYVGSDYCSSPDEVKEVWIKCYNDVGSDRFFEYEHQYISDSYYEPLMKQLNGMLNPNDHSRALQECLWSWSVHKGVNGAYSGIKSIPDYKSFQTMDVETLLNKIYDYRYNVNKYSRYSTVKGSERDVLLSIKDMKPFEYSGTNKSTGLATGVIVVPFMIKITCDTLNIRSGPGVRYEIVGRIVDSLKYTIVEVRGNWGKLKSGIGWISLSYVNKV